MTLRHVLPHEVSLEVRQATILKLTPLSAPAKYVYQRTWAPLCNIETMGHKAWQLRRHVIPNDPRTAAQLGRRALFAAANSAWLALDDSAKNYWRIRGHGRAITARNAFVSWYMRTQILPPVEATGYIGPHFGGADGDYNRALGLITATIRRIKFSPLTEVSTQSAKLKAKPAPLLASPTTAFSKIPKLRIPTTEIERLRNFQFSLTNKSAAPSASPDADPWGTAWTDQNSTGTNHAAATALSDAHATPLTEQRAFLQVNLQQFSGMTPVYELSKLSLRATNVTGLLAQTITVSIASSGPKPFTESTLTWSNQPATPATIVKTFSCAASDNNTLHDIALSDAEMTPLIGKWVLIVITSPLLGTDCTIASRRAANAAYTPRLFLNLSLPHQ